MKTLLRFVSVCAVLSVSSPAVRSQAPPSPAKPTIDSRAMELLKQNQEAMAALKSYQAECRTTITWDKPAANMPKTFSRITTVREARPNVMRWEWWEFWKPTGPIETLHRSQTPDTVYVFDGVHRWIEHGKEYDQDPAPTTDKIHTGTEPWGGFFTSAFAPYGEATEAATRGDLLEARIDGTEVIDGIICTKVYVHAVYRSKKTIAATETTYYIGPDHLVRRSTQHYHQGADSGITTTSIIANIKLNAQIDPAVFAYKPAKDVKESRAVRDDPSLLRVGSVAPDFTAQDAHGRSIKLSDYRGRPVVVDFWGAWCHPCVHSMPDNQKVFSGLSASGVPVVMLAVDDSDDKEDFDKWIKSEGSGYPALYFVYAGSGMNISVKQYKVSGFPTQYLIDKDGIIRATFFGSNGHNDELTAAITAALKPGK